MNVLWQSGDHQLLCKAVLAKRRGCEEMLCYKVPPGYVWTSLSESCFYCSQRPFPCPANTMASDHFPVSMEVSHTTILSTHLPPLGIVSLWQRKNLFISFDIGDQLSTHFLWSLTIQKALKKISHPVFTICEFIPCRKACLSSWKSNIKVYNLISTRDQTKNLVFLRDISAETYGIFQFVCT